jgi:hypothetical protein
MRGRGTGARLRAMMHAAEGSLFLGHTGGREMTL